MNILFIMRNLYCGGAEYQVRNIIEACHACGEMKIGIALEISEDAQNEEKKFEFLKNNGIELLHFYNMNIKGNNLFRQMFEYCFSVFKIRVSFSPDLIFVYDRFGILAIPFLRLIGSKVIYSERNSGEATIKRCFYRIFLRMCNEITCNSDFARDTIGNAIKRNVLKINNYVEVPCCDNRKNHVKLIEKEIINILIPARIDTIKNQMLVLESFKVNFLPSKVKIVFAGKTGNLQYKKMLQKHIKEISFSVSAELLDYIYDKELLYQECDLVVLPSLSEGTPNVVLECFARKIPVVASKIPQTEVLFGDKKLLFEYDSIKSFQASIQYLVEMEVEKMEVLLEKNYQYVVENFGLEEGAEKYVHLFQNMVK